MTVLSLIDGIKLAVKMEKDGRIFYLKASGQSSNKTGQKLLKQLSDEELIHQAKFEQIYNNLTGKTGKQDIDFQPDSGKILHTIFSAASEKLDKTRVSRDEVETVNTAIAMEIKSFDLYKNLSKHSDAASEKTFLEAVAAEERGHQLVLLEYLEYLKDPTGFFTRTERHSLDGG